MIVNYTDKLLSKNGLSCVLLSKVLLTKSVGDRIDTIAFYADMFKVGRGTIQYAMQFLEDTEAAKFEARGHKGTYISFLNFTKLFEISGIGLITCSMPLPYTLRYEGLATGLYDAFKDLNIAFNIVFSRGSFQRAKQLLKGTSDLTIVSAYTAKHFLTQYEDLVPIVEMDEYSFVGRRAILFREKQTKEIEDGMRIAYDESSFDQIELTKYLCKDKKVEFVNLSYNQIFNYLKNDLIDAAVWNGDEFIDKYIEGNVVFLNEVPLDDTKTVVLGNKKNEYVNSMLSKIILKEKIQSIQQDVLSRKIIPTY